MNVLSCTRHTLPLGNVISQYLQAIPFALPCGKLRGMDKFERRRLRLLELRDRCGSNAELARRIGKDASYVSRLLFEEGKKGKKRIGDDIIEAVLSAFQLPHGWLDLDTSSDDGPAFIDEIKVLTKVLLYLDSYELRHDRRFNRDEKARAIIRLRSFFSKCATSSDAEIDRLLEEIGESHVNK